MSDLSETLGSLARPRLGPVATAAGRSAKSDLLQDSLAGEQFGGQADDKTEHGQAAIPGLGEGDKTEAGGVSHECFESLQKL